LQKCIGSHKTKTMMPSITSSTLSNAVQQRKHSFWDNRAT